MDTQSVLSGLSEPQEIESIIQKTHSLHSWLHIYIYIYSHIYKPDVKFDSLIVQKLDTKGIVKRRIPYDNLLIHAVMN